MTAKLTSPFQIKSLSLKNRSVMAPMCQYSVKAKDGHPNDWHYVHYVSRAVGGIGLIIIEMTDVDPDGRITDFDLGIWSDDHTASYKRLIEGIHAHGAKVGIQIAHAGRKAEDAAVPVGPSDIPGNDMPMDPTTGKPKIPHALSHEEIQQIIGQFRDGTRRAIEAGVDTIELHGAHGYLLHQFMSPLINNRKDAYGEDRGRFGEEVIRAVKEVMPADMPLIYRISAVEYMDGGYDVDYSLTMARRFRDAGVDMFHVSSGGEGLPGQRKPGNYPGYQVPFARRFKEELGVPVIAVGKLENPHLAEATLANGDADLVGIARGLLSEPYWYLHAAKTLTGDATPPTQYSRAIF